MTTDQRIGSADRSELFALQTALVERAGELLSEVITMLNQTMLLEAPEDWDTDRWCEANNRLEQEVKVWRATFNDWVVAAADADLE
jgi:hypothetical protein